MLFDVMLLYPSKSPPTSIFSSDWVTIDFTVLLNPYAKPALPSEFNLIILLLDLSLYDKKNPPTIILLSDWITI